MQPLDRYAAAMTDQPPPAPATPNPTPDPQPEWSPAGGAPVAPPPAAPAPPAAKPPSKVRQYITWAVIAVVVAIGAYYISQNQNAADLTIGQCFDEPEQDTGITTVVKHACTEAHDAEVFHVVEYNEGDTFPVATSLSNFIDETCVPVFATYVGEPFETATDFDLGYFYPDREAWDKGDRTFTCYVMRVDNTKLTQSVKGAGAS
jgi:Septum formation